MKNFLKVNQLVINEILNLIKKDLLNLGVEMDVFISEKSIIENGFLDKVLNILNNKKLIYEGILSQRGKLILILIRSQGHNFYLNPLYLEMIVIVP